MGKTFTYPTETKVGDMLSFNNKGLVPFMIKLFSPGVSHIETMAINPKNGNMECISAHHDGVYFKTIEEVLRNATENGGTAYYHKLDETVRAILEDNDGIARINQCAIDLDGGSYDFLHLIGVGIDDVHINWLKVFPQIPDWILKTLRSVFQNEPTKRAVVCSAVFCWLVVNSGLEISDDLINPSEVTPHEDTMFKLFQDYIVCTGDDKGIRDYNTDAII